MATYTLTFGNVGESRPVPPLTLEYTDANEFTRAVANYAQPYLEPALTALGRPELADCLFQPNMQMTAGQFLYLSLAEGKGARFCPTRIERVS